MAKVVPFTKNRQAIYDLLNRAQRYHCTCATIHEFDIARLLEARERTGLAGRRVSLDACLIKATSLVIEKYPRLNHHLFHGLVRKYEVVFDDISCNLVMLRRYKGEMILLPIVIERSNTLSLAQIDDVITYHVETPIDELAQVSGIQRLKKLPRLGMRLFSYRCRSDHKFYRRYFGTYGYSPLIPEDEAVWRESRLGLVSRSVANTCAAFHPTAISEEPVVINGKITSRKTLTITFLADHYLIDGHYGMMAMRYLRRLLMQPSTLGLGET